MLLAHSCLALLIASPPHAVMQSTSTTPQTPPQQSTATPQKPEEPAPKVDPGALPVDLDRIQRALAKTPKLRIDPQSNRPVFRVQVFGDKPTIDDILGPNWAKGPVPYGGMTHQEFLDLVTPEDVKGYAAFSNKEGMTVAATSFLLQWTLQKAIRKFNETTDQRAREAARKEVLDALNALEAARAKAGMPPK